MSGMDEIRDITFKKYFVSDLSKEQLENDVKKEFVDYEVVDAHCSDPLQVTGAGADGKEKYELMVVISVSQMELGGLWTSAEKNGWILQDGIPKI